MPQLVAAAILYAAQGTAVYGALYTATAIGVSYATMIGYAVVIGAGIAYSRAQQAKLDRQRAASVDSGRDVMIRDPLAARRNVYGEIPVGGTIIFAHTTGAKNEYMHLVVVLATHEVDAISDTFKVGTDEVVLTGNIVASGKYAGKIMVNKHRGVPGDPVDADLLAAAPTKWDATHAVPGCAYVYVRLVMDTNVYPNGIPVMAFTVRGKKCWDPRSGLTVWTDNSALIAADHAHDPICGKDIAYERLITADLTSSANVCDELVALDAGGTEKRYTTNGVVHSTDDPDQVMTQLCEAMAGAWSDVGGKYSIQAGAHAASVMTITDADVISGVSTSARMSRADTFNRVRGTYISADNDWTAADYPAVQNTTYKAKDGGKWLDLDLEQPFQTSSARAQRIAKIKLERGRQQVSCSFTMTLRAMRLRPGSTVAVTRATLGWTAKLFEVVDWRFARIGSDEAPALGITLQLRETAAAVYTWSAEENTVDIAPNTDLPDPSVVGTPTVTLLSDSTTVTIQPDGTVQPRLKVSVASPDNIHVESGGALEIEYKKTTDSEYVGWTTTRGDALTDYILDVKVGLQYHVRCRWRNNAGVRGSWGTATSGVIVGDTVSPSASAAITATARPGSIFVAWTPSVSGSVNEYYLERSSTSGIAGFAALAQTANTQYIDASAVVGTAYWYRVYAQSVSGYNSSTVVTSGSVTAVAGSSGAAPSAPGVVVVGTGVTYDGSDGSVFARVPITMPTMPTGGKWLNLLYRRSGSPDYIIGGQYASGAGSVTLDDLSPGVLYDIAAAAGNDYGISPTGTSVAHTAASKTATPAVIVGIVCGRDGVAANYIPATTILRYGTRVTWTPSSEKDFAYYEVKCTSVNDDSSVLYTFDDGAGALATYRTASPSFTLYSSSLITGYVRVRAVNASGVAGPWGNFSGGNINSTSYVTLAAGSMSQQQASGVVITGGSATLATARSASLVVAPSGASNPRAMLCEFAGSDVKTLVGTAPTETIDVDITNRGFAAKPDCGLIQVYDTNVLGVYDYDTASSSTNARFVLFSRDGGNLPSGNRRFHFYVGKYT